MRPPGRRRAHGLRHRNGGQLGERHCVRLDDSRPLRGSRHGATKDDVHELLPQWSAGWSANYGDYYRTRLCSSRTGWLAIRPAITEVSCDRGLFVESDAPPT